MRIVKASSFMPPPLTCRPEAAVRRIIADVRKRGLAALKSCCERFDGGAPPRWRVPLAQAEKCWRALDHDERKALKTARDQLADWGRHMLPKASKSLTRYGMTLRENLCPVSSTAIYVPGGRFPLVSSTLMGLVPAQVAGVGRRVLLTPAKQGRIHPAILAAAHLGGATEIWAVGGAHGIAAAALGAGPLKRVDLIVGPGNSFVTEAKRQLLGEVGIDMLAGPSELLVILDESAPLEQVALDLLAQAEHGPDSWALALSTSKAVLKKLSAVLGRLDQNVVGLLASNQVELIATSERLASEHLMLAVKNPRTLAKKLHTYGTLFLGAQTPVALGDYVSGANHILPTGGSARWRGGLGPADFLARRMVQEASQSKAKRLYKAGASIAALEGLIHHKESLNKRSE